LRTARVANGLMLSLTLIWGAIGLPFGLPIVPPPQMARYAAAVGIKGAVTTNQGKVLSLPQDYADMLGWEDQVRAVAQVYESLSADRRAGAVLIALNWLLFIYAVATKQLLQASLGYFINPLLSVALGMIFLRERLRGWQWLAVFIALSAVFNLALRGVGFPWLAVSLAGSFGLYGLVRKSVDINSMHGLTIESALLFPIAAPMLLVWHPKPIPLPTIGLLSLSGVITAVPLLCFGAALRRLQLSTMGFLQYVGPTLQFLVAVCLFREPLDSARLGSFALCWLAIAVYVIDSLVNRRVTPVADEPE